MEERVDSSTAVSNFVEYIFQTKRAGGKNIYATEIFTQATFNAPSLIYRAKVL